MADISLKSPNVLEFGSFHITNTALGGFLTTALLIVFIFYIVRNAKLIPGRLQIISEMTVKMFYDFLIEAYGSKKRALKYLPFFVTMFLFLILANQFSVIPLINQIVTGDGSLLFRVSTADYSQPIALALISIIGSHIIAFSISPIRHIGNFIKIEPFIKARSIKDIANACFEFFLGVLDIIGEFAKFISISSRLFGNIFAGEVMITVIAGIASWTAYVLPIPFIALSIFSGFVQAYVFAVLALNFMAGTVTAAEPDEPKELATAKAL